MPVDLVPPDTRISGERVIPGLRFVERDVDVQVQGAKLGVYEARKLKILQQLWEITELQGDWAYAVRYEWRDVPLVTEEDANAGG